MEHTHTNNIYYTVGGLFFLRVSLREILKKNGFDLDLTDEVLDTEFDAMYTYKETGTDIAGNPFKEGRFNVDKYIFTNGKERLSIRPDDPYYPLTYNYERPHNLEGGVVLAPNGSISILVPNIDEGLLDAAGIFLSIVTDEQRAYDREDFKQFNPKRYKLLYGDD